MYIDESIASQLCCYENFQLVSKIKIPTAIILGEDNLEY